MMAGEDRPSPRLLSQALMKGDDGQPSSRNLTTLFAFFGMYCFLKQAWSPEGQPFTPALHHRTSGVVGNPDGVRVGLSDRDARDQDLQVR